MSSELPKSFDAQAEITQFMTIIAQFINTDNQAVNDLSQQVFNQLKPGMSAIKALSIIEKFLLTVTSDESKYPEYQTNKASVELVEVFKKLQEKVNLIKASLSRCPPILSSNISFSQLAGLKNEKKQMYANYIYPNKFPLLFQTDPASRNILLYGPPGTGKTLLVKSASNELKETTVFIAPSPASLKDKYVGGTESLLQLQFECAKNLLDQLGGDGQIKYENAVIFFDEFDAIASKRTSDDPSSVSTVNTLLQLIGGVSSDPRISIIAATNLPSNLDEGIQRRFTTRIFVDLPDKDALRAILEDKIIAAYKMPNAVIETGFNPEYRAKVLAETLNRIAKYGGKLSDKEISAIVDKANQDKGNVKSYSASDMDKMVNIAITKAALRVIAKSQDAQFEQLGQYYVYNPISKSGVSIAPKNYKSVIAFNITKDDFEDAMREYPPTVSKEGYDEVAAYGKGAQ